MKQKKHPDTFPLTVSQSAVCYMRLTPLPRSLAIRNVAGPEMDIISVRQLHKHAFYMLTSSDDIFFSVKLSEEVVASGNEMSNAL